MAYGRDPLSVRFDAAAGRRLGEAIACRGQPLRLRWVYAAVKDETGGAADAGGLTQWQRAYQRSLFWNAKQLGIGSTFTAEWRLQVRWGPETRLGRHVALRLLSRAEAARHRVPASERWTRNARLQSGGEGSPKARFG